MHLPLQFRLLGPVSAVRHGVRLPLSGTKIHTVLAALLLAGGRAVSDDRLSDMLWGDTPPPTHSAQIYTYVSRLRKQFGGGVEILRQGPGYVLQAEAGQVDFFVFDRLRRKGQQALEEGRHPQAAQLLADALACFTGDPLENTTEHLLQAERPRLESLRTEVLEQRIEADLACGRHRALIAELTALVSQFPMAEPLRAYLITALYRSSHQAEAVRVYEEGRRVLDEQLGVAPGPQLSEAYLSMLRGEPLPVQVRQPTPLPSRTTAFTGRAVQLARLRLLLRSGGPGPRTAQITGMAGSGKSALAAEVAHELAADFPDGVLHAVLQDSDGAARPLTEVVTELLHDLGEPGVPGRADRADLMGLIRRYRARTARGRLLVILDGVASDSRVAPLLPTDPTAAALITGRTRLASVPAVHTVALDPLPDEEGLALLSALVGPGRVAAEPDAARDVVRYCAGLPLALRIAGARLVSRPHWSMSRLSAVLREPAGRLHALSHGDADVRRSLEQGLHQLCPATRTALPWVSLLGQGPFTARLLADATGLAETQAQRILEDLVDATLLDVEPPAGDDVHRYRFHPLVLLFAESLPRDR
ncbi:AfsR/SARP family transcriptional regulator [Streptomyces lancefieldiae]|uniref:BTAD domain-containing putative transcriptional regulator n=1 Tax=Streptomyces lancefieldiae TaxID=3075520 RepID=A0ABU3AJ67_9ACTN|nr:BTAD domain-containing putative transcriptional regulator [Streptomyces sp. DSM 40712]MDT0610034.1 BTAD domain-containing putative transcriptional regulator [Streptomyces sp. DSM 40712]